METSKEEQAKALGAFAASTPPTPKKDPNVLFDYSDLHNGHIRQQVEISSKLAVIYQTLNGSEDEWIKEQTSGFTGKPVDYVATWYRNTESALGLVEVRLMGKVLTLPSVQFETKEGSPYPVPLPESVDRRRRALLHGLPHVVLLKVQYGYTTFLETAIRDLEGGELLKNG